MTLFDRIDTHHKAYMQKRILLVADNARRDFIATRMLQRAFQKKGVDARLSTLLNMVPNLRRFKPHGVMSNRANMDFAKPASRCSRIYVFPAEGAYLTKESMLAVFKGEAHEKITDVSWVRRCYVWSDYVRNSLMETGMFREDQLVVAGSPRLDVYRHHLRTRVLSKDLKEFTLGVAFSAKTTSAYFGDPHCAQAYFDFPRDMVFPWLPQNRHYEDVCWLDHATLRLSMRYLKRFLQEFPGKVIFRPSPFENENEYMFLQKRYPGRVKVMLNVPLSEFLSQIDLLMTSWSTTGLEAFIEGVPVISIIGTMDQDHLFRHADKVAGGFEKFVASFHLPSTEEEFFEQVRAAQGGTLPVAPQSKNAVEQLLKDLYNWPYENPAHEMIVKDVLKDLEDFKEVSNQTWKDALPIPHRVPLFLAPPAYYLRNQYRFYKRGNFRTLRDFYRLKDARVDALLDKVEREVQEYPQVRTFCWK